MIREGNMRDAYTGKAGQMAVLAELLARQCNVAVPEIDEGEDVLTFVRRAPDVFRIQVKTANAEPLKEAGRYSAHVNIPLEQLNAQSLEELYYAFAVRLGESFVDFVLIARTELRRWRVRGVGYLNQRAGELQLYLSFGPNEVTCSGQSWQAFRNAWAVLPVVATTTQT